MEEIDEAIAHFENSQEDWSDYRDYEKREMAFRAGAKFAEAQKSAAHTGQVDLIVRHQNGDEKQERPTSLLRSQLATAINISSADSGSNTPDFILGDYLANCLKAFDAAMSERDKYYSNSKPCGN